MKARKRASGRSSQHQAEPPRRKQDSSDEDSSEVEEGQLVVGEDREGRGSSSSMSQSFLAGSARPSTAPQAPQRRPPQSPTQQRSRSNEGASTSQQGAVNAQSQISGTASLQHPYAGPGWTNGEKAEAMSLIKEITALGLDPAQLVKAGIRSDIVAVCCRELNLPFALEETLAGAPSTAVVYSPLSTAASFPVVAESSEQGRKGSERKGAPASLPSRPGWSDAHREGRSKGKQTESRQPATPLEGGDEVKSLAAGAVSAKPKRQRTKSQRHKELVTGFDNDEGQETKNMLQREKAADDTTLHFSSTPPSAVSSLGQDKTLPMQVQLQHAPPLPFSPSAILNPSSAVEAMRQAALASMRRKKAAGELDRSEIGNPALEGPKVAQLAGLPADVPRGPRAARNLYYDIDAPQEHQNPGLEQALQDDGIEAATGEEGQEGAKSVGASSAVPSSAVDASFSEPDPRQAKRPRVSYADDYSWDVDTPIGEVDLEAPLPSLNANPVNSAPSSGSLIRDVRTRATQRRGRRRPVAADLNESSSNVHAFPARPQPFLSGPQWQRLVLDCSDDEDEDSDAREEAASKQIRQESTAFIAEIWKRIGVDDESKIASPLPEVGTPGLDSTASTARASPRLSNVASLSKKEEEIRRMTAKIQAMEKRRGQVPSDPQMVASAARIAVEGSKDEEGLQKQRHEAAIKDVPQAKDKTAMISTVGLLEQDHQRRGKDCPISLTLPLCIQDSNRQAAMRFTNLADSPTTSEDDEVRDLSAFWRAERTSSRACWAVRR